MFKKKRQALRRGYLILCLVLFAGVLYAAGQQSTSYKIPADVINSGGAPSSSTSYRNNGSAGQSSPLGTGLSTSWSNYPGFWQANFCVEDMDSDGLDNCWELAYGTSVNNPDTDHDGLTDGAEVLTWHTDPKNPDTDGDLMPDGWEANHGLNPLVNDAGLDRTATV